MSGWLRRLRGALGMGLTWAVGWIAAGMALLLVVGPDAADVPFPLGFGMLGFFAGALFSGVLSLAAGRRRFDELSLPRFAGWGAVGGLLFSVLFAVAVAVFGNDLLDLLVLGPVFAAAGAASAAGSLALARLPVSEAPPAVPSPDSRRLRASARPGSARRDGESRAGRPEPDR